MVKKVCAGISSIVRMQRKIKTHLFYEIDHFRLFACNLRPLLFRVAQKFSVDFIIIRSSNTSYHFVSPEIFTIDQCSNIQYALARVFNPYADCDYINIKKQIKRKITATDGGIFKDGNVLRLSDKPNKTIQVIDALFPKRPSKRLINLYVLSVYEKYGLDSTTIQRFQNRHRAIFYRNDMVIYGTKA